MQRNMLKILSLLLILTILTGCSATYEIHVTKDNTINETIFVYEDNKIVDGLSEKKENEIFNKLLDFERGYEHYKRETHTTEDFSGYKYTYNFNYEEYDAMSQLRKCYETLTLNTTNELSITTSKKFICGTYYPEATSLELIITSDYYIKSSNADKIEGNKHIWNINKNNYTNKPISIKFDTNKIIEEEKEDVNTIKIIIIFIIFFTLIIFVIKNRKKYKI